MRSKKFIFIILTFIFASSCHKSNKSIQNQVPFVNNIQIDTIQFLQFNSEDSLYIHRDTCQDGTGGSYIEKYFKGEIAKGASNPKAMYFHYALSTNKYGSYVVLYKDISDSSQASRIYGDSIEYTHGNLSMDSPDFILKDINHDGYNDIVISFSCNTAGAHGGNQFLTYDPIKNEFEEDSVLGAFFYNQEISIGDSEISSGGRSGINSWGFDSYRWNGKTYELWARENTSPSIGSIRSIQTREELFNGKWKIVKQDTSY
jgi:hypothetical protein